MRPPRPAPTGMVKKLFSIFGNFHYLKITFLLDLLLLMGNSKNKRGLNSQKKSALHGPLALALAQQKKSALPRLLALALALALTLALALAPALALALAPALALALALAPALALAHAHASRNRTPHAALLFVPQVFHHNDWLITV